MRPARRPPPGTSRARRSPWAVAASALALPGCVDSASRLCPDFYHPAAGSWTGGDAEGDVRTFVDGAGGGVAYTLRSIDASGERVIESNDADDAEVTCLMSADYRYAADALDTAFELGFVQREARLGQPVHEQLIDLRVDVEGPVDRPVAAGPEFEFDLLELDSTINNVVSDTVSGRFVPTATLGGTAYRNLLEQTLLDSGARYADVPAAAQWVRVLLAEGVGLVQYELLDGTVYTLAAR